MFRFLQHLFYKMLREYRLFGSSCIVFFKRERFHFLRNIPFLIQWKALVNDEWHWHCLQSTSIQPHLCFCLHRTDSRCSVVVSGQRGRKKYLVIFLGYTLIDSFTSEHSWPKVLVVQISAAFISQNVAWVSPVWFLRNVFQTWTLPFSADYSVLDPLRSIG